MLNLTDCQKIFYYSLKSFLRLGNCDLIIIIIEYITYVLNFMIKSIEDGHVGLILINFIQIDIILQQKERKTIIEYAIF